MPILHIIVSTQGAISSVTEWIFEPLISEPSVNIIRNSLLGQKPNLIKRVLRPLAAISKFPGRLYLGKDLIKKLKSIKPEDSVLFFSIENVRDVRILLRNMPPCKKKSVFFWDARKSYDDERSDRKDLKKSKSFKKICDVYTFDPDDASKFDLNLIPQVFREMVCDSEIPYQEKPFDLYFVGEDRGRLQQLIDIKNTAENSGLCCKFHITPTQDIDYTEDQRKHLAFSKISYTENIGLAEQSKCLLEITVKNQSGPTLRTMEAAFLGCKLITNRVQAKTSGLFPARNLMILPGEIFDFINNPPEKMDTKKLDKYNIKYWWKQFV